MGRRLDFVQEQDPRPLPHTRLSNAEGNLQEDLRKIEGLEHSVQGGMFLEVHLPERHAEASGELADKGRLADLAGATEY